MQHVSRFALSLLIALATCMGAFALVGCSGSSGSGSAAASEPAATASADDQSSAASDDEEQDNCYGDDMPARKS